MRVTDREAAHAARRLDICSQAYNAAQDPRRRLEVAFDWFRAACSSDRTIDSMARVLKETAERSDRRASMRAAS